MKLIAALSESRLIDYGWEAAIRMPDGRILTGEDHDAARNKLFDGDQEWERLINDEKCDALEICNYSASKTKGGEAGFIDRDGVFYDREQALAKWRSDYGYGKHAKARGFEDRTDNDPGDSFDLHTDTKTGENLRLLQVLGSR